MMTGRIHSIETCGTVDGPGIRFVLFLQGCPLRCLYCHNPDTWDPKGGKVMSVDEIMSELLKYRSYFKYSGGGITVTGGEPLLQMDFLLELLKACKAEGIHTAIDTSGAIFNVRMKELLEYVDLVILDIKHFDPAQYRLLTGAKIDPTLKTLDYLREHDITTWVRYVLVPHWSDDTKAITALAQHLHDYPNVEKVEVLPFHKMGEYKWEELGYDYKLKDTPEPEDDIVQQAKSIFAQYVDTK